MTTTSTRPELACEIVPEGVIAARRQPGSALLASASFAAFGPHAPAAAYAPYLDKDAPRIGMPGVHTGDPQQREAVVQTMRRALESVGGRSGVLTLVVPDQAVRVLVMDFDALPNKIADAVPLLRFRLKKMVPFDVDDAAVSYQVLPAATGTRAMVAVLPNSLLQEYEAIVREAGFEPGIVVPSTLACLGMMTESETALLVHSSTQCVTTAIAGGQDLLLHRTQELPWAQDQLAQTMNSSAPEPHTTYTEETPAPLRADEYVTSSDLSRAIDVVEFPEVYADDPQPVAVGSDETPANEGTPSQLTIAEPETVSLQTREPDAVELELHHALAVASAYFEDATGHPPSPVLVAGAMDARTWKSLMNDDTLTLRDLVTMEDMGTATASGLSRAQLGAVCGALRG